MRNLGCRARILETTGPLTCGQVWRAINPQRSTPLRPPRRFTKIWSSRGPWFRSFHRRVRVEKCALLTRGQEGSSGRFTPFHGRGKRDTKLGRTKTGRVAPEQTFGPRSAWTSGVAWCFCPSVLPPTTFTERIAKDKTCSQIVSLL